MAYVKTDDTHYSNIAAAIRALHEGTETYTPEEMWRYLSTQGLELKPKNIAKGIVIFGVEGTLERGYPDAPPIPEGDLDGEALKTDTRVDLGDKFLLIDGEGNFTMGYMMRKIDPEMASYNGVVLPKMAYTPESQYACGILKNSTSAQDGKYRMYVAENGKFFWINYDSDFIEDRYGIAKVDSTQDLDVHTYVANGREWEVEERDYDIGQVSFDPKAEFVWTNKDVIYSDRVLKAASWPVSESEVEFTVTDYDPETTEFKALGWLRVSYHATGEYAGQITVDEFQLDESDGWNYIDNIYYCTRDKLYFNGVEIWPKKPKAEELEEKGSGQA